MESQKLEFNISKAFYYIFFSLCVFGAMLVFKQCVDIAAKEYYLNQTISSRPIATSLLTTLYIFTLFSLNNHKTKVVYGLQAALALAFIIFSLVAYVFSQSTVIRIFIVVVALITFFLTIFHIRYERPTTIYIFDVFYVIAFPMTALYLSSDQTLFENDQLALRLCCMACFGILAAVITQDFQITEVANDKSS